MTRFHRQVPLPAALFAALLTATVDDPAPSAPGPLPDPPEVAKEIVRERPVLGGHLDVGLNRIDPDLTAPQTGDIKSADRTTEAVLIRKWLELREGVRGWEIRCREFEDRTLTRYFPNTRFYRLFARSDNLESVGHACVSLGQPLILPDDMNLLLVLENRPLTRYNVRQLSEVVVRMADPEGASTMHITEHRISRKPHTGEIEEIVMQSWSYVSRQKKRWTMAIRASYFYSLEEKLLAYRPGVLENLLPYEDMSTDVRPQGTDVTDDEIPGPTSGDERYIVFWRKPELRDRMKEIRARWVRETSEARHRKP